MKRIPFRHEIILVLTLAGIVTAALSAFFFIRLDRVVHVNLYGYGLQFNYELAGQHWVYGAIILNASLAALLAVEIIVYRVNRTSSSSENRPSQGWKEKLGIETPQDLLIFLIIIGVAVFVLIALLSASLGYIAPIPY